MSSKDSLARVYEFSQDHVRRAGFNEAQAHQAYDAYVEYVNHFASLSGKKTLDVGCGNGWSAFLLSQKGAVVTGVDLHAGSFEPPVSAKLNYKQGSATQLPFADKSFDIVTTHECLEHVENPLKALSEFDRVLKKGGYVCIVGPNLLSLLQSFRGLASYVWKVRPLRRILFRQPGMPFHPHGNTMPEIFTRLLVHTLWILRLFIFHKPIMKLRKPDLVPPFHADNDACYYLNPLDLKYYFALRGYEIINV
ncbi:class I SAM-dependent methyltransferase, partial [bacterium]|nr:class I SAM-dependent methyltransferase [bacterium]